MSAKNIERAAAGGGWARRPRLEQIGTAIVALWAAKWLLGRLARMHLPGTAAAVLDLLFLAAIVYLAWRFFGRLRARLLWRLRNRLILAYLFIAVVPIILLLTMAAILLFLSYIQLGAHLLADDLHERLGDVAMVADNALALAGAEPGTPVATRSELPAVKALEEQAREQLPGLTVHIQALPGPPKSPFKPLAGRRSRLVQRGATLWLESFSRGRTAAGPWLEVDAAAPVTADFLDALAPELGPVRLTLLKATTEREGRGVVLERGGQWLVPMAQLSTRKRILPPPAGWLDVRISGATTFNAEQDETAAVQPVLATFSVRPSMLNRRLFASLGEFREPLVILVVVIALLFLVIELVALVTGIVLSRTITGTVAELYAATERVKAGDFSYQIERIRNDQLGALAASFNAMTGSIQVLLEEQRKKQRLEQELDIAREVQAQLFPRTLPQVAGVRLAAVCRAARVVSGDYYDCFQLAPARLALAIADISGKGISAALLMASVQAALRSQALSDGAGLNTADMAAKLNRHLLVNSTAERYATFFYAVYDAETRCLSYTNGGHVPPVLLAGNKVQKLDEGGPVVGLLANPSYVQATIEVPPASLLVACSDGVLEPVNAYGEEFGMQRLIEEIVRHREAAPEHLVELLMEAATNWSGAVEQADDMTVLVARID
jgi:sigma-B regulation protein RsbU (phosphoserine phosphatase)